MKIQVPVPAILACLLSVLALQDARAEGAPRPAPLRLRSIGLAVAIDYPNEKLAGTATLEIENWTEEPAAAVSLLLNRLMRFDAIGLPGGAALPFSQEIVAFTDSPKEQVNRASIRLSKELAPGGRATLVVSYSGYLVGYTETGSLYIQDRIDPEFTILRADAYAFPVVGVPSWKANRSVPPVDFSFDVAATVPNELTVASGGTLVEKRTAAAATTWKYRSASPAPFLNVAVAKYAILGKDGIRVFAFPQDEAGGKSVLAAARRAIELFTRSFGPTTPPPAFAVIEIPEGWGSQASLAGGIIQTADAFREASQLRQLYHEISHFWNPPDTDLPSARWNEGLASYLERRAARDLDGRDEIDASASARAERLLSLAPENPRLRSVPLAAYGKEAMTDFSYSVGAILFGLLDRALGPARFDALIGGYYQKHRTSGAGSAEFLREAKALGGPQAAAILHDWFETVRWYERLSAGESLAEIAASYSPDTGSRVVSPETLSSVREFVGRRFPALKGAPLVGGEVCQYENTSNGDFLIDRHPDSENVWPVGGGSGHGFKHGPAVGEYVAARIIQGGAPDTRFRLATKEKVQKRSVY